MEPSLLLVSVNEAVTRRAKSRLVVDIETDRTLCGVVVGVILAAGVVTAGVVAAGVVAVGVVTTGDVVAGVPVIVESAGAGVQGVDAQPEPRRLPHVGDCR